MTGRADGYYWVRAGAEWMVAWWETAPAPCWRVANLEDVLQDADFTAIGPRIEWPQRHPPDAIALDEGAATS